VQRRCSAHGPGGGLMLMTRAGSWHWMWLGRVSRWRRSSLGCVSETSFTCATGAWWGSAQAGKRICHAALHVEPGTGDDYEPAVSAPVPDRRNASTYSEGEMAENPRARRDSSREHRPDSLQTAIALATDHARALLHRTARCGAIESQALNSGSAPAKPQAIAAIAVSPCPNRSRPQIIVKILRLCRAPGSIRHSDGR
jgi:hypothetical protein